MLTEAYVTKVRLSAYGLIPGYSSVLQVLLEEDGDLKRAVGIQYLKDDKPLRIDNVKRDVIIAGGGARRQVRCVF